MERTSTILIVDDDPSSRETLQALLLNQNYRFEFACNGTEALEQSSLVRPDVILLDVMMPDMDGFEVCRRLREDPQLSEVPVIMVTALDDRESRMEGIAAGADDFISKPVDRTELRLRVRTITRLDRYRHLMNERARFERLIELSPDGILIVDRSDTILLANSAMARILHADSGDVVVGMNMRHFVIPDEAVRYVSCLNEVISNQTTVAQFETVLTRFDESLVPVEMNVGYFSWDQTPTMQMIARDITERKRAEHERQRLVQELAERENRLQMLVEKLLVSQEEERRQVAYELHDGLAQVASSTHQHLQAFACRYRSRSQERRKELDRTLELAQRVVKEARQVIAGLRPTVLDDFGLTSALNLEVQKLRDEGWDIGYQEMPICERLPTAIETSLFRVAQEALTNIRKHARTTRARLAIYCQNATVYLEVQDWGCGFDATRAGKGSAWGEQVGLSGMQERVMLLGGEFAITSQPGEGTLVVARVPLPTDYEGTGDRG